MSFMFHLVEQGRSNCDYMKIYMVRCTPNFMRRNVCSVPIFSSQLTVLMSLYQWIMDAYRISRFDLVSYLVSGFGIIIILNGGRYLW